MNSKIFDMIFKILGASVVGALIVLLVTMWTHMNERISNCENTLSNSRSDWSIKIGEFKSEVKNLKESYSKFEVDFKQYKTSSKETHKDISTKMQDMKEKIIGIEANIKSK